MLLLLLLLLFSSIPTNLIFLFKFLLFFVEPLQRILAIPVSISVINLRVLYKYVLPFAHSRIGITSFIKLTTGTLLIEFLELLIWVLVITGIFNKLRVCINLVLCLLFFIYKAFQFFFKIKKNFKKKGKKYN